MVAEPPYFLASERGSVTVECDVEGALALLAVRGPWNRTVWRDVSVALRKSLAEHPAAMIVDLTELDDGAAASAPTWMAAQGSAAAMEPPVRMALVVPPELLLADRLQRMGVRRFLPVFAKVRQARVAIESRLPMTDRLLLRLAPMVESPALARELVSNACSAWGLPRLAHPGRLVMSELVTNAVEHAGTDITVVVSRRGTGLHLAVSDRDHRLPRLLTLAPPEPGQPLDERGRGLQYVHATATVWGAMPTPDGKVVWATIRAHEGIRRTRS